MSNEIAESDVHGRIAARLSTKVADDFCKAFGGRQVYIPMHPKSGQGIANVVGIEAAQAISEEFGSGGLLVPLRQFSTGKERRRLVADQLKAGRSHTEIAQALNCHVRTVGRIKDALHRDGVL